MCSKYNYLRVWGWYWLVKILFSDHKSDLFRKVKRERGGRRRVSQAAEGYGRLMGDQGKGGGGVIQWQKIS